jgi:hypothetical protein
MQLPSSAAAQDPVKQALYDAGVCGRDNPDPYCDTYSPIESIPGDAAIAGEQATATAKVENHTDPADPVGDAIQDQPDPPAAGFFPTTPDSLTFSGLTRQEAAAQAMVIPGIPSDCLGYATPASFNSADKIVYARGGVTCKKNAFITVTVCVSVKQFGIGFFSFYKDISCTSPIESFSRKAGPYTKGAFCLSGTHKYRSHVYVKISRGSCVGSGNGYQAGRLKVRC